MMDSPLLPLLTLRGDPHGAKHILTYKLIVSKVFDLETRLRNSHVPVYEQNAKLSKTEESNLIPRGQTSLG